MANPTTRQLKSLCEKIDLLILGAESLRQLRAEKPEALDKANVEFCRVGATPALEAVRTQFLPEEHFPIEDFLVVNLREQTFIKLYNKIDTLLNRTEILRRYYDRTTQVFNRRLCELNHRGMILQQFTDIEDMLNNVNYLISVVDGLRKIIHSN